jgi:hypothetical protein
MTYGRADRPACSDALYTTADARSARVPAHIARGMSRFDRLVDRRRGP